MALKVELKPGERIIIGDSVITNSNQRTRLFIEGDAPILREKDVITASEANSPARRIYLALQLMYISRDPETLRREYETLAREFVEAAPSSAPIIDTINTLVTDGEYYRAIKQARELVLFEERLIGHA
ncbi:flagellar biosynthesis repressor FlbT [Methyloraptor flagellatus]|uniref:Flagellar biosynthesis repressor FlbT n=1 Tax=Methyloraptor flagellatus TaxID=3162530 RepID=A0AAU7XBF6_9HYPH